MPATDRTDDAVTDRPAGDERARGQGVRPAPPRPSTSRARRAVLLAAALAVVVGPLHALARLGGPGADEADDPLVAWWTVPAADALEPVLAWADPDTVYRTYGLVWFPALAAAAWSAWSLRRQRAGHRGRLEAAAWWPALVGLVLLALGAAVSYWLGLVDVGFVALTLPGLLLALPGQTVLGVGLLLAGARPRRLAVLLVLTVPLVVLASSLASQALGAVVVVATWAVAATGGSGYPGGGDRVAVRTRDGSRVARR